MWKKMVWPVVWMSVFGLFVITGIQRLDPDFGWHWRMGKLILEQGIIMRDRLTYTMPNYPFVDFHWGSNVLMYWLYELSGMNGLAVFYALLATLSIWIILPKKGGVWRVAAVLLIVSVLYSRAGHRPQIESWFLFALIVRWFFNEKLWNKTRWMYPMFMCAWANLHGGFVLGWTVVGLGIFFSDRRIIPKVDKQFMINFLVLFLGVLATLINPFGVQLWVAIWKLLSDPLTKNNIAEWRPFYWNFELGLFLLVMTILVFGKKLVRDFPLSKWVISVFLFLSALGSIRNAAMAILFVAPMMLGVVEKFFATLDQTNPDVARRTDIFSKIYLGISVVVFLIFVAPMFVSDLRGQMSENNFYPKGAVEYLKTNQTDGNIFTIYDWGGYMSWRFPEEKMFIDGRMPEWRYDFAGCEVLNGSCIGPEGELWHAFADYIKFLEGGLATLPIDRSLNVNTVLLPIKEDKKPSAIDMWANRFFGDKKSFNLHDDLIEKGWISVFEDSVSIVYRKHETN